MCSSPRRRQPLYNPEGAESGQRCGGPAETTRPDATDSPEPAEERPGDGHHCQLTELYPQIEGEQAGRQEAPRQLQGPERRGEPEPVDQPEGQGDAPAAPDGLADPGSLERRSQRPEVLQG